MHSQTESPMSKGPSASGRDGGLAARVEAAAKSRAPQPMGKGIAMVVLAVLVMAAVTYEIFFRSATPKDKPATTPVESGADGDNAPAVPDPRFDLPGELSAGVAQKLAMALTQGLSTKKSVQAQNLDRVAKLFGDVPAKLRKETRARVLVHLSSIAGDTNARGPVLDAARPWVEGIAADEIEAARRLTLHAELALDDDASVVPALIYLSQLPPNARPTSAIEAVVLDEKRPETIRVRAAFSLRGTELSPDVRALLEDKDTPRAIRDALQ